MHQHISILVFIPLRLATLINRVISKVLKMVTFGIPAVFHSSKANPRGESLGSISFFIAVVLPQKYKKNRNPSHYPDCGFFMEPCPIISMCHTAHR
ncbi:MAG: hypothetical protein J6X01_06030, partial [Bacteroidales bacterium]|nr:hypothetical protein [Bacteroidales bacterium]